MKKIIILDDHEIIADSIADLLSKNNYAVLEKYNCGKDLLSSLHLESADLLLLDLSLPGMSGFEVIEKLKQQYKSLKILVLTSHNNHDIILKLHNYGVEGYLSKSCSSKKLLKTIDLILKGNKYFMELNLNDLLLSENSNIDYNLELSQRESEIVFYIAQKATTAQIADKTCISEDTVKYHKKKLYKKLSVSSRHELLALVKRRNLL